MGGASQIIHFNATRIRANGIGNLDMQMQSYDSVETEQLVSLAMSVTNARELNRLMNFKSQYGRLKLSTDEIDEVMNIDSIVIFVKPLYSDYPS